MLARTALSRLAWPLVMRQPGPLRSPGPAVESWPPASAAPRRVPPTERLTGHPRPLRHPHTFFPEAAGPQAVDAGTWVAGFGFKRPGVPIRAGRADGSAARAMPGSCVLNSCGPVPSARCRRPSAPPKAAAALRCRTFGPRRRRFPGHLFNRPGRASCSAVTGAFWITDQPQKPPTAEGGNHAAAPRTAPRETMSRIIRSDPRCDVRVPRARLG